VTGVSQSEPIDLSFRPKSYFWPLGLNKQLLAKIKGAARRSAVQHRRRSDVPESPRKEALVEIEDLVCVVVDVMNRHMARRR
jgi:hypothetical protein